MSQLTCRLFSQSLRTATTIEVVLPELSADPAAPRAASPVVYVLHGLSDDETIWLRRTSIERYAKARGLAVVMPRGDRSFYCDMASGPAYWTYLSEELPRYCQAHFPVSIRREDTFACGFSMGGYGAFKLALARPDRFSAAVSLSGVLDLEARVGRSSASPLLSPAEQCGLFGPEAAITGTPNDLFHLARCLTAAPGPKPRLLQLCGTEDYLYDNNQAFRAFMSTTGLDWTYEESPGSHTWEYVDGVTPRALDWLVGSRSV